MLTGIKHSLLCINLLKVPREMLKTKGITVELTISQGTWRTLSIEKSMSNYSYNINSMIYSQTFIKEIWHYVFITVNT